MEDDADISALYKRLLEKVGHDVTEATDGNIGIALFRQTPFDLIITDIIMPEKEGLETIMELRRDFPDVKIIAISGGGKSMSGTTCLHLAKHLGAVKTLAKPLGKQELLNTVGQVLEQG